MKGLRPHHHVDHLVEEQDGTKSGDDEQGHGPEDAGKHQGRIDSGQLAVPGPGRRCHVEPMIVEPLVTDIAR